ncbi:MAG: thiol:disulfide interchange protein DsbA/DsbL [Luteimonas sp.]
MIKKSALLLCLVLVTALASVGAWAKTPALVDGTDYATIADGRPYAPLGGKIEVVEVFGYWCSHCAEFQPKLSAWTRTLPSDVRFTYVPAVFSAGDSFARAYFAAEHFGVLARTHDAMFPAIHVDGVLAQNATVDEIATYYGQHGLDAAKARAYMTSPEVAAKLAYAHQFALRSEVEGTPTLVVNGRYRILGASHEDSLRIASQLIAQLRTATRHSPQHASKSKPEIAR